MVLWSVKLMGVVVGDEWWPGARGVGPEWFRLLPADAAMMLAASAVELVSRLRMVAPAG